MSRSLQLIKPVIEHIRRGHPFVFRDALKKIPSNWANGEVVDLIDAKGHFVARGTVEPDSALAFRMWTLDPQEAVDQHLLRQRLIQAQALRREIITPDITGYRLCHGENDGVPGLQCDLYQNVASLRTDGALGLAWEKSYIAAIEQLIHPSGIVVRNPQRDGGQAKTISGTIPTEIIIQERNRFFAVNILSGQKTGFFLDQRDNRDRVAALAAGRRVLNLFAYTGGFSVAAALAGASYVMTVDIAQPAIEMARQNFGLNHLNPQKHGFEAADAFEVLNDAINSSPPFDFIILDPPAFAPSKKTLPQAQKAYLQLNELAFRALPNGGWLATSSCSSHLRSTDFLTILAEAARRAHRTATITGVFGAAPDHPTRPGFPEGDYLKFILARVTN